MTVETFEFGLSAFFTMTWPEGYRKGVGRLQLNIDVLAWQVDKDQTYDTLFLLIIQRI